jgi:hypothetical protein
MAQKCESDAAMTSPWANRIMAQGAFHLIAKGWPSLASAYPGSLMARWTNPNGVASSARFLRPKIPISGISQAGYDVAAFVQVAIDGRGVQWHIRMSTLKGFHTLRTCHHSH